MQIKREESAEKMDFCRENIKKNSQLEAASLGKPGVFTGTTFGRRLSRTGLLPKGFFVPIFREAHSTYISIGELCKEGFQSSRESGVVG